MVLLKNVSADAPSSRVRDGLCESPPAHQGLKVFRPSNSTWRRLASRCNLFLLFEKVQIRGQRGQSAFCDGCCKRLPLVICTTSTISFSFREERDFPRPDHNLFRQSFLWKKWQFALSFLQSEDSGNLHDLRNNPRQSLTKFCTGAVPLSLRVRGRPRREEILAACFDSRQFWDLATIAVVVEDVYHFRSVFHNRWVIALPVRIPCAGSLWAGNFHFLFLG